LKFPIVIVLPDPTVTDAMFSLSPLAEVNRLPRRFSQFTARDVRTWLNHVVSKNSPDAPRAIPFFQMHDVTGAEIATMFHELADTGTCLSELGGKDPVVVAAIQPALESKILPWEQLQRILGHIGMQHTYATFVEHDVSFSNIQRCNHKVSVFSFDCFIMLVAFSYPEVHSLHRTCAIVWA
jgi:hypothetical protein